VQFMDLRRAPSSLAAHRENAHAAWDHIVNSEGAHLSSRNHYEEANSTPMTNMQLVPRLLPVERCHAHHPGVLFRAF
jgi:hypothetical protein